MRRRFFSQDPRYIALKELNGEGKYRRDRSSTEFIATTADDSGTYTPTFKKRMSDAFSRRSSSRLSFVSSNQWKRNSFNRALTATKDAFGAIPICRRSSHHHTETDEEEEEEARDNNQMVEVDKKRASWVRSWMTTPMPDMGCTFTVAHSTLFVAI